MEALWVFGYLALNPPPQLSNRHFIHFMIHYYTLKFEKALFLLLSGELLQANALMQFLESKISSVTANRLDVLVRHTERPWFYLCLFPPSHTYEDYI